MADQNHPVQFSDLYGTLRDGETRRYTIKAGVGLARYLAREIGSTGMLTLLLPKMQTVVIHGDMISDFYMQQLTREEVLERGLLDA